MEPVHVRALKLFAVVLAAVAVADLYLLADGGPDATFSTAMGLAGKHSPFLVAAVGFWLGVLLAHWFNW